MDISVVLPCLNESETLGTCIKKANNQIKKLGIKGEIIIADNGSDDGSIKIAKKLGARVINVKNKGYGNALRAGIKDAKGKYILIADADDSYNLNDLPKFYKKIKDGFDIIQGCRLPKGGGKIINGAMPITHKLIGNPLFSLLTKVLYQVPFNDVYCGMKILRKKFFKQIEFFSTGMVFCLEILIKSKINKAKMSEIPITLFKDGRKKGTSHLKTISDGLKTLKFIMICSPKLIFFIPSLIFFVSIPVTTLINFKIYDLNLEKIILIDFLLLFLSLQFFMLGIYSTLRAKQINLYNGNLLNKFFRLFKLRYAIIISLLMIIASILLKISDFKLFNENYNFIIINLIALLGINIIANSFFVSLLVIKEKDFVQTVITKN
jgi:glycosyltransferase involved in cell wall biosynthesis